MMGTTGLPHSLRWLLAGIAALGLVGCGGGSDSAPAAWTQSSLATTWTQGSYAAASSFADQCAAPRTGINPATGVAYVDKQGSTTLENFWIRSWEHELYLWYDELPDLNPADYSSTETYFGLLKSSTKDKSSFHFTYDTATWQALSQSGVSPGYGVTWVVLSSTPPRNVQVAYTEPGSPATSTGINLSRGEKVVSIDGVSVDTTTSAGVDTLNEGLWPSNLNETHTFVIQALDSTQRTVVMTSASVTETPVANYLNPGVINNNGSKVGYLIFNDHIATAEYELIQAFTTLQQAGVNDLILDLRYNGGGYLDIASETAYMIAGSAQASNRTFERLVFNNQYPTSTNPVTGGANTPTLFHSTSQGFSSNVAEGTALPSLNLSRVFVITGSGTCSASEAIINGLQGIGLTVIRIGSTTCGKPYGFYPQDNCGTTYFSIEFQGVNDANFGDYASGFAPTCSVQDDLTHSLGSTSETRLAATLFYQANQYCSPAFSNSNHAQIQSTTSESMSSSDGELNKGPWRENRIMRQ